MKKGGFAVYFWKNFADFRLGDDSKYRKVIHNPMSRQGNKVLVGSVKQGLNTIYEYTFSMPMQNTLYQQMVPFQTIIQVVNLNDNEIEFEGRVLSVTNKMTSTGFVQEVICEDFLSFLHDSTQHFQKLKNDGAEANQVRKCIC